MGRYYVAHDAGGGGVGSEGTPYTIVEAADVAASGDVFWVKNGGEYGDEDGVNSCIVQITKAGTAALPIAWIGYGAATHDNAIATLNAGTATLTSAVITAIGGSVFNVFKNIRLTGGSGDGFDANGLIDDHIEFRNVRFDNNSGWGFQGDNNHIFVGVTADNNTAGGIDQDGGLYLGVLAHTNSGIGLAQGSYGCAFNYCYNNGGNDNIYLNTANPVLAINNSIDGDNVALSSGIFQDSAFAFGTIMFNNILYDLAVGLKCDTNALEGSNPSDYNLFFSNDTDRTQVETGDNDVAGTGDPFTDSGARDYTLKAASEALEKMFDAGEI